VVGNEPGDPGPGYPELVGATGGRLGVGGSRIGVGLGGCGVFVGTGVDEGTGVADGAEVAFKTAVGRAAVDVDTTTTSG
jgi:hypothetical protein